jgi:hypothetical protein
MMHMRPLFCLLVGLALLPAQGNAQGTVKGNVPGNTPGGAQEFQLQERASLTAVPLADVKPKTILFADQAGANKDEVFISYEEWAKAKPLQQQILSLYPGYNEPNVDIIVDGTKRRYSEKLHMYVAQARFIVAKPQGSINLARLASLPFAEQLDPAIKHRVVTAPDVVRPKEAKSVHNQNPQRRWCEGRPRVVCLHSTYKLEGRLPVGIALANKIREGGRQISDTLEFEGELTLLSPSEVVERGLTKLTELDTPSAGAIEQSIFYVNQVMQFGKLFAVFQQHPADPNRTVVTVFMTLAVESNILVKRREYAQVPVLRNLVPAQVLGGKSSFNSGRSLSAGLPVYARNQVKAIAAILERDGA